MYLTLLFSIFYRSLDLEEASVRANLALSQKKLVHELDGELYEESEEYRSLCTDVVRTILVRSNH